LGEKHLVLTKKNIFTKNFGGKNLFLTEKNPFFIKNFSIKESAFGPESGSTSTAIWLTQITNFARMRNISLTLDTMIVETP